MSSVYDCRWNNAVKVCSKINNLLSEGYKIFDEENKPVIYNIKIDEENKEILLPLSENSNLILCDGNPEYDNGIHDTIKEFNSYFDKWTFINPKDVHSLKI